MFHQGRIQTIWLGGATSEVWEGYISVHCVSEEGA